MLASNRSHPEEKTPPPRRSREGGVWTREADADLRSKHLRHQLGLGEEEQVIVAAGLGVGARHVEAAEGMDSHQGAGALAVEVQVPHVELGARLFQVGAVPADHRSGEAVFRVVGDAESVVEILGLDERQHRTEISSWAIRASGETSAKMVGWMK